MRYLFILIFLAGYLPSEAQTKPIAYKSHAGDMDFFLPEHQPEDDFGNPAPQIMKFVKINDTTVVEVLNDWGGPDFTDTVVNHPHFKDPNMSLEEIKTKYHYRDDIKFIGFDKKETTQDKATIEKKSETATESKADAKEVPTMEGKACPKKKVNKKSTKKNKDKAMIIPVNIDNTPPPPMANNVLPWLVLAASGYLAFLGFLLWKRQREKIIANV
jgi:hypothetical protein